MVSRIPRDQPLDVVCERDQGVYLWDAGGT